MSVRIDPDQCTGCGSCLSACPLGLLHLSGGSDLNTRGVRSVRLSDPLLCAECGRCEQKCTAAALHIPSIENGYSLLDKAHIPPHSGCYLGSLARALADAVWELGGQKDVVLFKKKAADVNLLVESHDYPDEHYFEDGLRYKHAHPEKLVILICSSSKSHTTLLNETRCLALQGERITLINTLNWFECDPALTTLTCGGSRLAEQLAAHSCASFVARSSVRSTGELSALKKYLKQGLLNQLAGKPFSLIEMTFPCFYRLTGRPQTRMPYEQLQQVNQWFDRNVKPLYPEGVLKGVCES